LEGDNTHFFFVIKPNQKNIIYKKREYYLYWEFTSNPKPNKNVDIKKDKILGVYDDMIVKQKNENKKGEIRFYLVSGYL
jgi:hypothetical protein